MPDVWTSNPQKLRNTLQEAGITCGVEPRVLKPRDPQWTCIVDSKGWLRDIYIHPIDDFFYSRYFASALVIAAVLGMFAGLLWGRRFWTRR